MNELEHKLPDVVEWKKEVDARDPSPAQGYDVAAKQTSVNKRFEYKW